MKLDFSSPDWQQLMQYAYTRRFDKTMTFVQEPDCVVNRADPTVWYRYDNIPLLTREKVKNGVTIRTRCSFESFGAPLIMMAKDVYTDESGVLRFDDYYEVVLWEKGINVWRLWQDGKDPAQNGMTWRLLAGVTFPVSAGEAHDLCVTVKDEVLAIETEGHAMSLYVPGMFEEFYAGIDACEGINRFYTFSVEEA